MGSIPTVGQKIHGTLLCLVWFPVSNLLRANDQIVGYSWRTLSTTAHNLHFSFRVNSLRSGVSFDVECCYARDNTFFLANDFKMRRKFKFLGLT